MHLALTLLGLFTVLFVFSDTFNTIVMPKSVRRSSSLTSLYYRYSWPIWELVVKRLKDGPRRVAVLSSYGPLSLLLLMVFWACLLIVGFGMIHYGAFTLGEAAGFGDSLYFSGVTFLTLGFGDLTPVHAAGRVWAVLEAGVGFGFLAIVISYIPVLSGAFSRREHLILLLDSKAGSDPTAGELLRRHANGKNLRGLTALLKEWEVWSAQQLEACLSYPILAYYRSQHDDQSWLNSLTCILDACALIIGGIEDHHEWERELRFQAQATFAMGRHLVVDLAYILYQPPDERMLGRLSEEQCAALIRTLAESGIPLHKDSAEKIRELRALYEPYCVALAREFFFVLPAWLPTEAHLDNWQTTAWDKPKHF